MSGNIFDNCTFHFSFEKDYEKCVNTTNPCQLIQDMSTNRSIRLWMGFYIPSVIFFLAVVVDIYCLSITIYLLRKLSEEVRKRYVFVFIRLSSAILAAICIVFFQSTYFSDAIFSESFTIYAIFFVIYDFSLFSLLGSFTGVAIMTYFGVMRPLVYRDKLSVRGMYWIAAGIWIGSACIAIPIGLFQAADAVDGPIKCESESCQLIVKWLLFSVSCIILLSATSTLIFVTSSLYWHHYKSKKMGNLTSSASDHGRARLAWTTVLMVILCCIELVPIGILLAFGNFSESDECDIFYRADKLLIPTIISSLETLLGAITFLLDPFINFFFDRHISRFVSLQIKYLKSKLLATSSRNEIMTDSST